MKTIPDKVTISELEACFEAFSSLLNKNTHDSKVAAFAPVDFQKAFSVFSDMVARSGTSPHNLNVFELCSLRRDEVRNCRVLAWLLDKNAPHDLGARFLERLLFPEDKPKGKNISKEALASSHCTRTEVCPNADHTDRVDIVCESSTMLVYIEVKIDSQEHTAQTDRYYKRLLHNAAGRQCALIFISTGSAPANAQARQISWREIGAIASELAEEAPSDFVGQLLRQYASFVSSF